MARMIPQTIGDDAPPGERAVFAALRDAPRTDNWVVFHSLEIARHVSQVQGEADFVIVASGQGIPVIEVKSHESIEADGEGRWRYGNRDWVTRSPFEQASGAQHSIIEHLHSKGSGPVGYRSFTPPGSRSSARASSPPASAGTTGNCSMPSTSQTATPPPW